MDISTDFAKYQKAERTAAMYRKAAVKYYYGHHEDVLKKRRERHHANRLLELTIKQFCDMYTAME